MTVFAPTDWPLSEAFARSLLEYQCPDLAALPLSHYRSSWDHELYRLGDHLLVRLPKHEFSVPLIDNEQRWLPTICDHLTTYTPRPVFSGVPCEDFPWPWSVVPFVSSRRATVVPPSERSTAASSLADFFASLHLPAPTDAPKNLVRGVPLSQPALNARFRAYASAHETRVGALLARWSRWTAAPAWDRAPVWVHGDITPLSLLLTEDGDLAGVIDWGNITSGDPACDLASAWLVFDEVGRRQFINRVQANGQYDPYIWSRAKAWALLMALGCLHSASALEPLNDIGQHALSTLLGDAGSDGVR